MSQGAPHPRMHGLTHVAGGPDPVPFLPGFPTGDTLDEKILALLPAGFWKLNETTGHVAADSSGHGQDLSTTSPEVDPLWGFPAGPPGQTAASFDTGTSGVGGTASKVSRSWPALTGSFTAGIWVNRTSTAGSMVMGQGAPGRSGGTGWQLQILSDSFTPANTPRALFATGHSVDALNPLPAGIWAFLAVVYDSAATEFKLYRDGLLEGTSGPVTYAATGTAALWVGHDGGSGFAITPAEFAGSYAFLVNRAMSGTELSDISAAADLADVAATADHTEWVLGVDENGNPAWQPPGVSVEHGDGPPDETPVPGPPPASIAGSPVSGDGWHLDGHYETVVLYDSTPGRFDVPTLKWTRVPFNTVRFWRTWETTAGGPTKTAWLEDDRGLTTAAKQGFLHVTAAMENFAGHSDDPHGIPGNHHYVQGWFGFEYPIVDFTRLPDDDVPVEHGPVVAYDEYVRGCRYFNLSAGTVLRESTGSGDVGAGEKIFFQWPFPSSADGDDILQGPAAEDTPFPIYPPNWPDWVRPLHLPLPYPQLSPSESRSYYVHSDSHSTPFSEANDGLSFLADLSAGMNLCFQAWQDTPYTLRFTTDHWPSYTPLPFPEPWKKRGHLAVTYFYDPDLIDHATGKVLQTG